jgi:hypothetical protein
LHAFGAWAGVTPRFDSSRYAVEVSPLGRVLRVDATTAGVTAPSGAFRESLEASPIWFPCRDFAGSLGPALDLVEGQFGLGWTRCGRAHERSEVSS